eukprot:14619939-Alexandrium_andersonii.AAC.1
MLPSSSSSYREAPSADLKEPGGDRCRIATWRGGAVKPDGRVEAPSSPFGKGRKMRGLVVLVAVAL